MIFQPQSLAGLWLIEPERHTDARGFFARTFCAEEFARHGLPVLWAQSSTSFNAHRHTLRGLHWQASPHGEGKLVRCTRGRIFDVAADLRPSSPTYCGWLGFDLSADNGRQLYIPEGFAHGFLTLENCSEVFYQITVPHDERSARGMRWNDPALAIHWPGANDFTISERDKSHPNFQR